MTMTTKLKSYLLIAATASCLAGPVRAQSSDIANEMKQIAVSLQDAKSHLQEPTTRAAAVRELAKVAAASERAQKLEPSAASKAAGAEKDTVLKNYRLNLQLMIEVVKAAGTAAELDQPETALNLLKVLDPMTAPAHSQPFK